MAYTVLSNCESVKDLATFETGVANFENDIASEKRP